MKTVAILLAASAALANAQVTNNNGTFTCAKPNAAYCAGTSLGTDIIIRCDANGVGLPGRCGNNLVGQPPVGVFPASCWQSSETAGDAACEKNCIVYASLASTTFTLPTSTCTPFFTASTSSASATSTSTTKSTTKSTSTTSKSTESESPCPTTSHTFITSTGTGGPKPTGPPAGNSTSSSSTRTPVGPTSSRTGPTTVPTAGAAVHQVGGALAIAGLVAAYFI